MNTNNQGPLRAQIYQRMDEKETDELLEMWRTGNQEKWTGTAFDILEEILHKRLGKIPFQEASSLPKTMSQEFGTPSFSQPPQSFSWIQAWTNALTRPSVATFEDLVRDPKATSGRAYAWTFLAALIGYGFGVFLQLGFSRIAGLNSTGALDTTGIFESIPLVLCGIPIAAFLSVLGLMINAGVTQLIAHAFGGIGTYSKLVSAFAAYLAPLTLITGILSPIPFINLLIYPLGLYGIILNVISVRAVNQFGWGKSIASSFLIVGGLVLVSIVVIAVLMILGPTIGSVFSTINSSLNTP